MKYSKIVDGWYHYSCPDCGEPLNFTFRVDADGMQSGDTCRNCDSRVVIIAGEEPYLYREGPPGSPREGTFRHKKKESAAEPAPVIKDEKHFAQILKLQSPYAFEEVRQAYKEQMKQYHPDQVDHLGPDLKDLANRMTKDINEAYAFFERKFSR